MLKTSVQTYLLHQISLSHDCRTCCPALAKPSIASSADAISSPPLFATSLLGIASGGGCAAMPAAAALLVRVAAAMPDAMNASLQDGATEKRLFWFVLYVRVAAAMADAMKASLQHVQPT